MKTYKVAVGERELTLRGLTNQVKEDVTDVVRANEIRTNARLLKKGLITGEEYLTEKQSVMGLNFASEPLIKFITTPEGKESLVRAMVVNEDVTDAEIQELVASLQDSDTAIGAVFTVIFEDAYPKK